MEDHEFQKLELLLRKFRDSVAADREEWDKRESLLLDVEFECELRGISRSAQKRELEKGDEMKRREEFGKRCQLCWKNREAHMYGSPVRGKYRRLCKLCWGIIDTSNANSSTSRKTAEKGGN